MELALRAGLGRAIGSWRGAPGGAELRVARRVFGAAFAKLRSVLPTAQRPRNPALRRAAEKLLRDLLAPVHAWQGSERGVTFLLHSLGQRRGASGVPEFVDSLWGRAQPHAHLK